MTRQPAPASAFTSALAARQPTGRQQRDWVYVPYDQLSDRIGPLATADPERTGIILVENPWKAALRPYHRQKLALVLASGRHFALEMAERGFAVRHVVHAGPYRDALAGLAGELGTLTVMEPAERELRADLAPLIESGQLRQVEHDGWLTSADQFRRHRRKPPWRMDGFYRLVRKETGILIDANGQPEGGKWSLDHLNRQPWKGEPAAATPPRFQPDEITAEVIELVEREFADHPGRVDPSSLPASRHQVTALWTWAKRECLRHFGPYEDAMSVRSSTLFHTRISALLHLHRLLPQQVVDDVLDLDIPLHSKEGFVRQVLGWREFMHHAHRETDGFRNLPGRADPAVAERPGDGGHARWRGQPAAKTDLPDFLDGGARPAALGSSRPLPPVFWGADSGMRCLDQVVGEVWDEAYGHHITRLMVLSNLATLLDVDPRELTDWFWVAYADAYDWVVEPNVLGMGSFALGDLFTTKPYVSGAAYLARMSDYCRNCAFDAKKNCPVTSLYWAFLSRHREQLDGNPRLTMPLRSAARRKPEQLAQDAATFEAVHAVLGAGDELTPVRLEQVRLEQARKTSGAHENGA